MKIKLVRRKILADTLTPISIYLKLRDLYPYTVLMESSDYRSSVNSRSVICACPISGFSVDRNRITIEFPDNEKVIHEFSGKDELLGYIDDTLNSFEISGSDKTADFSGFFGYTAYDAVRYFEKIKIESHQEGEHKFPEMLYKAYRFVIIVDHYIDEIQIHEHLLDGQTSRMSEIIAIIKNRNFPVYDFKLNGNEVESCQDLEFLKLVDKGIEYCRIGEVYQIVISRKYRQNFIGDDFNVYRKLRSINPSPYLFYFDFGNFRIFGSSPEAQLTINGDKATINPIAGTFRRNGTDEDDLNEALRLKEDEKENAEHVMLVDLARNDLSRNGTNTTVESFKEIQYYSHVIHLVSRVTAKLNSGRKSLNLIADTFPAGTLTGAPKYRAMELISMLERSPRGYYGGAIGFLGFNGNYNHAIMIRSIFSRGNTLIYQAGAGITAKSIPENELLEVDYKLNALRMAIRKAGNINDR